MPDFWELENGLDPFNPDDRNEFGTDGYTRLEHYLNGINGPIVKNNDQELSAASFTVYPNPFNNEIIFNYKGTEPIHSISLYNSIGQVVYVNHFPESNTKVIINHLSAGTYFAKIETSSGVLVKMISKI